MSSTLHWSEEQRLAALRSYDILDTPAEADFDDIVKLAADICGVPISLISLVETERQWFKAKTGIDATETPIAQSICAHAIMQNDVFIIPDTTQDARSNCNPLVTGDPKLRFYAGAVLKTQDDLPIGMLCVLDFKPGDLTEKQRSMLQVLARQVMTQLELRKTVRQQRESEEQFRQLANTIPQMAWMADETGYIFWYNQRWYDYTGMSFEDMKGWGWEKVNDPVDMPRIVESWKQALSSGQDFEGVFRLRRKDGEWRAFLTRAQPIRNEAGKIVRWFGTNTDIEDARRSESAMHEVQGYLGAIVASSDDAIISKDLNGIVTSWNKSAERIFGYTSEEMVGKPITMLIPLEQMYEEEQILTTLKTGDRVHHFETMRRHKEGQLVAVSLTLSPIRNTEGKVIGASKIARDVTESKKLQLEAREAKERAEAANMAKTEFLATMSHEIRTPMNAVIGLSNILAKSQPLAPKQQEYIKTLQMSANSLLGLINDLLDIAKIEAHSVELEHIPFSVAQLIQETVSMMNMRAREKGLTFNVVEDCKRIEGRLLLGDPTRLRQILVNLCSNAVKFTEKGSITLHVSCAESDAHGKEIVHIAVEDTGIGIPADKIDDIFHKFTQADSSISRKYGGTGLGLAITKTLAEIMGGTIHLKSELGKGSIFTVTLPLEVTANENIESFNPKAPVAKEQPMQTQGTKQARVLLVEDYEPNVLVAETFLESFGYAVDVASNGMEAIEKIKNNDYIATLMDVQMHGMNGLEATQLIRSHEKQTHKPRIYIIGMTAHALVGDRERCIAAGMDDYIAKPFNPDRLEEMLAEVSQQRAAA